jgi:hypothetical protein
MKKVLLYAMNGEKMCFQHVLLNALDIHEEGGEVKIIFEGPSVKLVPVFEEEKHPLYLKAKEAGLIAGVCFACSKVMGVLEGVEASGLALLDDMKGHAGFKNYLKEEYEIVSI